jgi:5-methylcytosine-specific restriction protein A
MPTLPTSNKCAQLGCHAPKVKGSQYCVDHGAKPDTMSDDRRSFNAMYRSRFWASMRQGQLSRHPLCASCMAQGIVTQGDHVDHLFPWAKIGKDAFTRNLFQTLCAPCHSVKTSHEQRGDILHFTPDGVKTYKLTDYAYIMGQSTL